MVPGRGSCPSPEVRYVPECGREYAGLGSARSRDREHHFIHVDEIVPGTCAGVQNICGFGKGCQFSAAGDMVGVNMGVDDVADFHSTSFRHAHVGLRIVDRVAHGGQALSASAKYVRGSDDGIRVKQLPENHLPSFPSTIRLFKISAHRHLKLHAHRSPQEARVHANRVSRTPCVGR